jgi:cell division protein FtsW
MSEYIPMLLVGVATLAIGAVARAFALPIVTALVRFWVWLHTLGLRPEIRERIRDEVASDLWEQENEARSEGTRYSPDAIALHILLRLILGMPGDAFWRLGYVTIDYGLLAAVAALTAFGMPAVYGAGLVGNSNTEHFVVSQSAWALVAAAALFFLVRTRYRGLRPWSPMLMLAALIVLAAVLVPGIGVNHAGVARWIALGRLGPVQPTSFAGLAFVIYLSAWLSGRHRSIKSFSDGFVPLCLITGLLCGLVMAQPDMSMTLVIGLTATVLLLKAGGRRIHALSLAAVFCLPITIALAGTVSRHTVPSQAFAYPATDAFGARSDVNGIIWWSHTGGLASVFGSAAPWVATAVLVALYTFLVYRGVRISLSAPDNFGALMAIGITAWIAFQAALSIVGAPAPFASYSGSGLYSLLPATGVLLSISREASRRRRAPVRSL